MQSDLASSKHFFLSVLFLAIIGSVALDVYLPSLPFIRTYFSVTNNLVQLSLTAYLITYSLSQLIYGPISDRFGRKKISLLGILISCIGTLICLFSFNIYILLLGRLVQGLGLGAGAAVFRPILRDVFEGDSLSHFGSIIGIGAAVAGAFGPTIGGYIQHYSNWRGNFLFLLLFTLFAIFCIWRWLPETNRHLNPHATKLHSIMHNYLHILKSPIFIGYTACASLSFGGIAAYLAVSPFLFQNVIGLTAIEYGMLSFFLAAGMLVGSFINSRLVKKIGRHRMLVVGIALLFISSSVMLLIGLFRVINTSAVIIPLAFCIIGGAIIFANSFAGAFIPFAKNAGCAGALYGCLQMGWGALATLIISKVDEHTQVPLAIFLVITSISSYFFQLLAFKYFIRHYPHE